MTRRPRTIAGVCAGVVWASLALQLSLLLRTQPPAAALWLFFGFFTVLTNILVAAMATGLALGRTHGPLAGAKARMAITAAIVMVGIAYWILLAALWKPTGMQLAADIGLHSASPILALATWFVARDGTLEWKDSWIAAIWPSVYAAYALARGHLDGWYAYWFFDPSRQGWGEIALSISGLSALVIGIGAVLIGVDRQTGPDPQVISPRR